ncbi:MAG: hypothetical protein C0475_06425 [Planctomyces sp.]|nr:hypothetical protein [Planctomyces sp.]MBA4119658.1 hypothetical protein [Isosphaera sp.]
MTRPRTIAHLAALATALALWAMIALLPAQGRIGHDQNIYHVPTIRTFARQLPRPDLSDYLSATTPGYHLALAAASRLTGDSTFALRALGALWSVGLAWLLVRAAARRASAPDGSAWALAALAPLPCSLYVLSSGAFVLPDNAAWLLASAVLLVCLGSPMTLGRIALGALLVLALVWVRQSHAWTAGVLLLAAWLGDAPADGPAGTAGLVGPVGQPSAARWSDDPRTVLAPHPIGPAARRAIVAALLLLPTALSLALLYRLWGGLTPPGNFPRPGPEWIGDYANFQGRFRGANPATPALVLALLGWSLIPLTPLLWGALTGGARRAPWLVIGASLLSLAAALIPATTRDPDAGRSTGLWNLAGSAPTVLGHTSALIAALALPGGALTAALLGALRRRDRLILLTALAGFGAAVSASHYSWQRYAEPMLLIWVALAVARLPRAGLPPALPAPGGALRWALSVGGLAALCLSLAAVAARGLR